MPPTDVVNRAKEQLKDRRDYRETLIQRRNDIDVKIAKVEEQIKKLKEQPHATD